ncbi:MAG: hypothetical protein LBS30_05925 [Planctomycetota bacterium]|nr:hypothetical protein [Planctomycetota bacterium]
MICETVERAIRLARLDAILVWPSGVETLDDQVRKRIRRAGAEVHLWLPVLADAGTEPPEEEQTEDAWGARGHGASGSWRGLGSGDESFLFACPRSRRWADAARERIHKEAPLYDGVFLDRIRYPSPANGFESLFTCFCPRCLAREPEAALWRERIRQLRKRIESASDRDVDGWKSFDALLAESGLDDFRESRSRAVRDMAAALAAEIRAAGKAVGLDLFTPAIAPLAGQEYRVLAPLGDWIKPMSYCHAKGPAGLPLELASFVRGMKAWGRGADEKTIAAFAGRSFGGFNLPESADRIESHGLDECVAGGEFWAAADMAGGNVYPGFECVRHPDFDLDMDARGVGRYLDALSGAPGLVLAWNILYTPEEFLRLAAEGRQ